MDYQPITDHSVFAVLGRHRWKALVTFALVLGSVGIALVSLPRRYESEAKLFVRVGRESVGLDPTATIGRTLDVHGSRQSEINSVVDLLESRGLFEQVVGSVTPQVILGSSCPDDPHLALDETVLRLRRWFAVSFTRNSSVVSLQCDAPSPELAQKIVQTFVDSFRDLHVRLNRTAGSHDFFLARHNQLQEQLDQVSDDLRTAKNKAQLADVANRRVLLEQQIAGIETAIRTARSQLGATEAKTAALKELLTSMTPRLLIPGAPLVGTDSMHPTHQHLTENMLTGKMQSAAFNVEIDILTRQYKELQNTLCTLNEQELHIMDLDRQRQLIDESYRRNHQHLEQARIEKQLADQQISNINVAQPATFVAKSVAPKLSLWLALGLIGAISGAVAVAMACEWFGGPRSGAHHTVGEIERRLDVPVMLVLPESNELKWWNQRRSSQDDPRYKCK